MKLLPLAFQELSSVYEITLNVCIVEHEKIAENEALQGTQILLISG